MASNFEGEISDVSEPQLKFIANVLDELGYANKKAIFENVGKAGDNYSSNIKRIIIENGEDPFRMIAKIAPANEMQRATTNTQAIFKNEQLIYTELFPKYSKFQDDAGIPEGQRLRSAKFYGSFSEAPNEVILLEDLTLSNFIMHDRFQSLTDECIKSVLKQFAILHSLAYVLKIKEPETNANIRSKLINLWAMMEQSVPLNMYFNQIEQITLAVLDDDKYRDPIKNTIGQIATIAAKMIKIEAEGKHSVIIQGDTWTNNIMFRYLDNILEDTVMIDYQQARVENPVYDIQYLIFNCTDYETRSKYFYEWLDYYHTELDKSLANYGLNADSVYPKEQFDRDMKKYGKMMFGVSVLLANMMTKNAEDAEKLKEMMTNPQNAEYMELFIKVINESSSIQLYKKRVEGLVDSFLDFGLL